MVRVETDVENSRHLLVDRPAEVISSFYVDRCLQGDTEHEVATFRRHILFLLLSLVDPDHG